MADINLEQLKRPEKDDLVAVINTNLGEIRIKLFPEIAPKAVQNFTTHAKNGYYDGVIFHRVMKDFMVQTGDPNGTGMGGNSIWGNPFEDEFHPDYHHFRGAVAMANRGPNTNGSQFFIVQKNKLDQEFIDKMRVAGDINGYSEEVIEEYDRLGGTPWLDFSHTVFGQVYDGIEVVDKIVMVTTDGLDKPLETIEIKGIEILKY